MPVEMYRLDNVLVARGATWDFNPKVTKESFAKAFKDNPIRAMRDYGAIPPESVQSALPSKELIATLYDPVLQHPILDDGGFAPWFMGDPSAEYYFHGDLSKTRDSTGLAMCHYDVKHGKTVLDLLHALDPKEQVLSFERVLQIVLSLIKRGFRIKKVTFDGWQSLSLIERLVAAGIPAEVYSVDRSTEAYDTLINELTSGKLRYYFHAIFVKELQELQLLNGKKYDHPPAEEGGSKDVADAAAGCVTQCVKARTGLTMDDGSADRSIHAERIFSIQEAEVEGTDSTVHVIDGPPTDPVERTRRRTVRFDVVNNDLVFMMGWFDKQTDHVFVDEYLLWRDYSQPTLEFLEAFIFRLIGWTKIAGFSLSEATPIEIITMLQGTGLPITSPLSLRVPGQHRMIAQGGKVTAEAVRMTVAHLKRGTFRIPNCLVLMKDLKYATDDNLTERPYLCALASWYDFTTRESAFGRTGRGLPTVKAGSSAPLNAMVGRDGGRLAQAGANEIDQMRVQHGGGRGNISTVKSIQGPSGGMLPTIRRG